MALAQARAGALNKMVEIQYDSTPTAQDATGQPAPTWTRFARAWASVESVDMGERFQANREVGRKLRIFTIRWRNDIDFNQRILYESEHYNIRNIKEVERKGRSKFLDIIAELIEGADGQ